MTTDACAGCGHDEKIHGEKHGCNFWAISHYCPCTAYLPPRPVPEEGRTDEDERNELWRDLVVGQHRLTEARTDDFIGSRFCAHGIPWRYACGDCGRSAETELDARIDQIHGPGAAAALDAALADGSVFADNHTPATVPAPHADASELATLRVRDEHYEILLQDNLRLSAELAAANTRLSRCTCGAGDEK